MKKLLTLLAAVMLLSGTMGLGKAQAFTFELGGNYFLMNGNSYLYQQENLNSDPTELWGLFNIKNISSWFPLGNDINGLIGDQYWPDVNTGNDGNYFAIKFGGLLSPEITASGSVWNVDSSFAELWLLGFDAFSIDDPTYSDVLAGIGTGESDSFGLNISTYGQKLLEMKFDSFITAPFGQSVNAYGYLSVTGGVLADQFDSDFFYNGADLAINGQNFLYPSDDIDWNYTSNNYAAYANVVPEPGTLLLLGAGMLGLAACARKRRQN